MPYEEYRAFFESFVRSRLTSFYDAIKPFYQARGGNPDSLTYFRAHWPRFEAMIDATRACFVEPSALNTVCEIGSFYPYTTLYFKWLNPALKIDLFDIMPREIGSPGYDIDGVRLVDLNLCTEPLPKAGHDVVVLSEVIEHLPIDLFAFERAVIDTVAPGGILVVTYPLGGKNAKDYGKVFADRNMERLQEDHVREFTVDTVPLFFKSMNLIDQRDVRYPAYGLIRVCSYQRSI